MKYLVVVLLVFAFSCTKDKKPDPDPVPVCEVDLKKGLIAYYPFNGNFNDESGNNSNATAVNGASLAIDMTGRPSSAAKFDGYNDYLTVAGSAKLDADSISISVNVLVNTINRKQALLGRIKFQDATSYQWGLGQQLPNDNAFSFEVPDKAEACSKPAEYNTANTVKSSTTIQAGKWYNVVATFGKGGQKIYINGTLVDSVKRTFNTLKKCSDGNLIIGGWWNGGIISMDGKMDDVRIYNRELAKCEIEKLAEDVKTAVPPQCETDLTNGLMAYYPFNGNANDESGNGNNGVAVNGASFVTDFLGRPGKAAGFDGINDYILVQDNGKLKSDTVTVSMVVMVNQVNRRQAFLSRVNFDNATGFSYGLGQSVDTTNKFDFGAGPADGCGKPLVYNDTNYARSTTKMIPGRWYHLVGVFVNGKQQLYIDGKLESTLTRSYKKVLNCTPHHLSIGGWWKNDVVSINGKVDDVRIYNRALNDCEIAKLSKIFKE